MNLNRFSALILINIFFDILLIINPSYLRILVSPYEPYVIIDTNVIIIQFCVFSFLVVGWIYALQSLEKHISEFEELKRRKR